MAPWALCKLGPLLNTYYIETKAKWPPFCRWHFQICLLQWILLYFDSNCIDVCPWVSIGNMLALDQIMAWHQRGDKPISAPMIAQFTDVCIYASLGPNDESDQERNMGLNLCSSPTDQWEGSRFAPGCWDFKAHFRKIQKLCHNWSKQQHKMGLDTSNVSTFKSLVPFSNSFSIRELGKC